MSVSPIHAVTASAHLAQPAVIQPMVASISRVNSIAYQLSAPLIVDVPNFQGFTFNLVSASGKPPHDLAIQTETFNADGSASFTGTWTGKSGAGHPVLNGRIYFDASGNVKMSFAWANGSGSQNTFLGTITPNTSPASAYSIWGPRYHIEGDVTAASPGDGPGHVSGSGSLPPPVFKVAL